MLRTQRLRFGTLITLAIILGGSLIPSVSRSEEPTPQMLLVHFFGVNEQEHGRGMALEWIKKWIHVSDPFIHQLHIFSSGMPNKSWKDMTSIRWFANKGIIVEVIIHYPADVQQQQRLGQHPYPGESAYTSETVGLLDSGAAQAGELVKDFHGSYPDAKLCSFATGLGVDVA